MTNAPSANLNSRVPVSNPLALAVVIVSWNVSDLLAGCLDSLFNDLATSRLNARVLVIDNASTDGSAGMVLAKYPRVELTASKTNLGFAGGNNCGLALLGLKGPALPQAPFVLLLNPDTEVQPGAIKSMLEAIQSRSDAALVTSQLFYGDGSFQPSAFHFPGLAQLYMELLPYPARFYDSRLNGRYSRQLYAAGTPFEIDHPLGAAMLVRSDAIEHCGLLDESFALYCEEIDWAARFKESGWKNYCAPAARIVHHSGKSTSQVKVASFEKLWRSRYRLHVKHPRFAPLPLARVIVKLGMRRKMQDAPPELRAACQRLIEVWNG